MEHNKIKCDKLLHLPKQVFTAIENDHLKTIDRILLDTLKYRQKIAGKRYKETIEKDEIQKLKGLFHVMFLENKPHIYKNARKAKLVYEINMSWHLLETKFQNGFCRHTFLFENQNEIWKLIEIKKELIRFSKYKLKTSLDGLLVWLIVQTNKLKNGYNQR